MEMETAPELNAFTSRSVAGPNAASIDVWMSWGDDVVIGFSDSG
jgi:hypothetical protein